MPLHLLFPLFSSVVFVVGMLYGKRAISAGASPWTTTFYSNFWLALAWTVIGAVRGELLPWAAWGEAALIGLTFVLGQMFSFLAFQYGDVSVATPVFGVKVIMVAAMMAVVGDEPVSTRVWIGAALATIGVAVMQIGGRNASAGHVSLGRATATIVLALLSGFSLSVFDVGLQTWGKRWGTASFVPAALMCAGLFSFGFLPWSDRPRKLRTLGVLQPLLIGTLLIALQAMSMSYSLGRYGDATRINIVYALRGLWAVGLSWWLARALQTAEAHVAPRVMLLRLLGAILLTASVVIALWS